MANQTEIQFFRNGSFDSALFVREMQDKEGADLQELYKQALAQFIVIKRERVDFLVRARTEATVKISKRNNAAGSSSNFKGLKLKRKERRHLQDIEDKIDQQRYAVRHWSLMTEKFGVTLDEVSARVGYPEGSTFRTLFPELFREA